MAYRGNSDADCSGASILLCVNLIFAVSTLLCSLLRYSVEYFCIHCSHLMLLEHLSVFHESQLLKF
jgi:hypothetical protein